MPTTVMTNPVVWEVPATAAPSTRALLREPFPEAVRGLTFTPAAPGLWRVTRADGLVLGHIERRSDSERYRVRRMRAGTLRSLPVGEFWSPREAADVFQ
ncbi:MAG: hypothetical protein B5766_07605 [Candidatus Lumbricidophila eiseniae]|uniref:Uncharacterized protein n=1 Tax=Candidatus Lumbricidiphila eiseniae TaxID=1969409 RepID=A0A2A6FQL2_9MICO|nr:MAG: hypothetical protein B5766_07605 [Candidatus Lumbricidophila eiseniae]